MGAKQSEQMAHALELIFGPRKLNASQAAALAGVTKGAISKNAQYRAHVEAIKNAKKAV